MLNRNMFRFVTFFILLIFPLVCFAEYKVVVKKNGKIIEGKLVSEDETSLTIISAGARLRYSKDTLDLERMKKLNADYYTDDDVRTVEIPAMVQEGEQIEATTTPDPETSKLADVAKQNRNAPADGKKPSADFNEKAMEDWVVNLQEQNRVNPSEENQIDLSKAKKALTYYRSRSTRQLSNNDKKLMFEQLVKALDSLYRKELEAGSPDEKTSALKKKVNEAQEELSKLE